MARRDTYNYTYRVGRRIAHRGITSNPERREKEHQRARLGSKLTVDDRADILRLTSTSHSQKVTICAGLNAVPRWSVGDLDRHRSDTGRT